ncbi:MAG: hypothetical protein L0Z62_19655 [Gemmataceae bacterium]|nr:hypothetical protein [Gemmataceae bacterium]
MSFKVKTTRELRGQIGNSGLNRTEILRLHVRLLERLENVSDEVRAQRSTKYPDCFILPAGIRGHDADYRFRFFVNDQAEPGVLIVQGVFCERLPRQEED